MCNTSESPSPCWSTQMVGALMPLVILSDVTFQPGRAPYAPAMEGQEILKNPP